MDLRSKLIIDRLIAKPVAWAANVSARALGEVLRRDHSVSPENAKVIAVGKLLGLGSIIQATPFLRSLRAAFPAARLVFVTTTSNRALIERLPFIDEAIYVDDASPLSLAEGTSLAIARLVRLQVDLYFDLEVYSAGASTLALMSGARNRYGFYRHSAAFKKGIYTHIVFFNCRVAISELYLQLFRVAFGGDAEVATGFGPIVLRDTDRTGLAAKARSLGLPLDEPYLVVNPNASDLLLERRWPLGHFATALEMLAERGHRLVLVGAPTEAAYVGELHAKVADRFRSQVINTSGKLKLEELFALIDGAGCVITNDTGPMHVSIALARPTVCLFGPGNPEHYGVYLPNTAVLYERVFCSPCVNETDLPPCAGANVCMQRIAPSHVVEAAEALLGGKTYSYKPLEGAGHISYTSGGKALGVVARSSLRGR